MKKNCGYSEDAVRQFLILIKHAMWGSPDGGCNAEFFTMPGFLEIESLGPLAPVEPGDCVRLDERWEILPGSAQRASESTVSK